MTFFSLKRRAIKLALYLLGLRKGPTPGGENDGPKVSRERLAWLEWR